MDDKVLVLGPPEEKSQKKKKVKLPRANAKNHQK